MKRSLAMIVAAALVAVTSTAQAADWLRLQAPGQLHVAQVQPVPEPMYVGPGSGPGTVVPGEPIPGQPYPGGVIESYPAGGAPLYTNVRYKDLRNIHPCAVPKVVMVPDPCADPCCGAACVPVQICVPPCGCERVKVSKGGNKIKYDYGKYQVEIRVKRNHIEVDYDD